MLTERPWRSIWKPPTTTPNGSQWNETATLCLKPILRDGDVIEIVSFVGGG